MRLVFVPVLLGILTCLGSSLVHAETAALCLQNALPIETLGNDAEQRDALLIQAKQCVKERKPVRAVALLSQIIRSNPSDVEAYVARGNAQAYAGELGLRSVTSAQRYT